MSTTRAPAGPSILPWPRLSSARTGPLARSGWWGGRSSLGDIWLLGTLVDGHISGPTDAESLAVRPMGANIKSHSGKREGGSRNWRQHPGGALVKLIRARLRCRSQANESWRRLPGRQGDPPQASHDWLPCDTSAAANQISG
jgi:hypothetical protein